MQTLIRCCVCPAVSVHGLYFLLNLSVPILMVNTVYTNAQMGNIWLLHQKDKFMHHLVELLHKLIYFFF